MRHYKTLGFTLIELLVVIAIIGVLAVVVTISIAGQKINARDSRRAADSSTMEKTLASFYANNFEYPRELTTCDSSIGSSGQQCPPSGDTIINKWRDGDTDYPYRDLVPIYLSNLPKDPLNNTTYYYSYEPSNNPVRQCATWQYWIERDGPTLVKNNYGDLTNAQGVIQIWCGDF